MLCKRFQFLYLVLWVGFLGAQARAQRIILVPSSGAPTIQAGIDAASTGDTVLVAPGTYRENLVIDGKEITLTSQAGPSQTIVIGIDYGLLETSDTAQALVIRNTPSLATTVSGFTFEDPTTSVITPEFYNNGVGILVQNAGATIRGNAFSLDFVGLSVAKGAVDFRQNTLDLTTSGMGAPKGSGVFLAEPGAVVSSGELAASTISANTFTGNGNGTYGIQARASGALQIDHNQFTGALQGVSLQEVDAQVVVENNLFTYGENGAIEVDHSEDNPPSDPANTFILNNTMYQNLNGPAAAGPVSGLYPSAELRITGTYSRVAVVNNIFSTNSVSNPILTCDPPQTAAYGPPTPLILDHNLFWNPSGPLAGGQACTAPLGNFGNLNANPQFVSSTDLHLSAASPAVDAGVTGFGFLESTDLDGNPRVQDGSGKGFPLIDIGAYEFTGKADADVASLVLTSSAYYLLTENSVTLTAALTDITQAAPLSSEPVTFQVDGGGPFPATTDSAGEAVLPVSGLLPGLHTFTASFAGGAFSPSVPVAPATAVVLYVYVLYGAPPEPTQLTLTSSGNPSNVGAPVTLTVGSNTPDGMHPGPITLHDGGTLLATLTPDVGGIASFNTSTLAVGPHTLVASFAGDSLHQAGMVSLTQVVQAADFSLSSSTPSVTVKTGSGGSLILTVASIANFTGTVHLACGDLPVHVSCSFANAAPQLAAGASATSTLTIATDAASITASTQFLPSSQKPTLACLGPLALLAMRRRKRRLLASVALVVLLLPAAWALQGCGNLALPLVGAAPGTYLLPVNGTSVVNGIPTTHTVNLTLVVTP